MSQPGPPPQQELPRSFNPPVALAAAAEVLAASWIAGRGLPDPVPYLLAAASALLFAAGSGFAAHFTWLAEQARDPRSRSFSPRPAVSPAWGPSWGLLLVGLLLPGLAGIQTALAAVGVAVLLVLHAAVTRQVWGVGFFTSGAARGLNVLVGLSAYEHGIERYGLLALGAGVYVVGWEVLRTVRQPGAPPITPFAALIHLAGGTAIILYQAAGSFFQWPEALPFLLFAVAISFPLFVRASMETRLPVARDAVQHGLLGLALLEAGAAAGYAGVLAGAVVALLAIALAVVLTRWPVALVQEPR